jgi:hypothetical protein
LKLGQYSRADLNVALERDRIEAEMDAGTVWYDVRQMRRARHRW